jgi:hypothetical protein
VENSGFHEYQQMLRDRDAWVYKMGQAKGHIRQAQRMLFLLGTKRFGLPEAKALAAIEDDRDLDHLEQLSLLILDAKFRDWNRLLGLE